jgi:hypothetical protein
MQALSHRCLADVVDGKVGNWTVHKLDLQQHLKGVQKESDTEMTALETSFSALEAEEPDADDNVKLLVHLSRQLKAKKPILSQALELSNLATEVKPRAVEMQENIGAVKARIANILGDCKDAFIESCRVDGVHCTQKIKYLREITDPDLLKNAKGCEVTDEEAAKVFALKLDDLHEAEVPVLRKATEDVVSSMLAGPEPFRQKMHTLSRQLGDIDFQEYHELFVDRKPELLYHLAQLGWVKALISEAEAAAEVKPPAAKKARHSSSWGPWFGGAGAGGVATA